MQNVLTVSEVNRYIRELISRDIVLNRLWVKGEISNFKYHYSGHLYFTLKDDTSLLRCVMFRSRAQALRFKPENGLKVIIGGYVSVFERDGQYQLYAEEMQPDGLGNLHLAFEQLKARLQQEGLFDARYKKKLPFLPRAIGVVTSSTGAVIRDIINVLGRRFPNVEIKLFPVAVQGELAARQVAYAIKRLNELNNVDVIILARGGGSLEELWAFNEEIVARSIFASRIPIISAIGHETDFTIADFVADLRAPTPSAAAELVIPEKIALQNRICELEIRLKNSMYRFAEIKRTKLEKLLGSVAFRQPFNRVYQERMRLDVLERYMVKAVKSRFEKARAEFAVLAGKLDALSPLTIISRGYGIIKSVETGKIINSVSSVKIGDRVRVEVADGNIDCIVENVEEAPGAASEKNKEEK